MTNKPSATTEGNATLMKNFSRMRKEKGRERERKKERKEIL